ncbi:MAG: plasmid partitioning protein RepB [Methylocystis sp.]|uniref:plasmid partitioning protein RepB n=1 Tax=Methylocystis sp. TaxID=1911079 RepID=UPI003DA65B0A
MSRRDTLKSLLAGDPDAGFADDTSIPSTLVHSVRPRGANLRIKTGPILHLASDLRAESGDAVIEVDPTLIDSSFIKDRIDGFDSEHSELVESIRDHGQQVPVLLRPHPDNSARYQVVYGHRRVRACQSLGRAVRAVVKTLTDAQLVVAQGQENSARMALSYIERAFFSIRLSDSGFERDVIMAALSVSKSHLSTLISVGRRIPATIIQAVGPAPKTGEPRWVALADRLEVCGTEIAAAVIGSEAFGSGDSDERFLTLFNALQPQIERPSLESKSWSVDGGRPIATFREGGKRASLIVDQKEAPEFGRFLFAQLPELYRDFLRAKEASAETSAK